VQKLSLTNRTREVFFELAGILFLFLSRLKFFVKGYSSPRPFPATEYLKCVKYDINVVQDWLTWLNEYSEGKMTVFGKNVLELGPGSDLGVGLLLLSKGVAQYNAIDKNDLIQAFPERFYDLLFAELIIMGDRADVVFLKRQLEKVETGSNGRLNYIHRDDFDIQDSFAAESIDIVFSQAAFEHFDDVEKTIEQISTVVKQGGVLISLVDLKTHSRWIREKDPNNIYRYSKRFYNLFSYSGCPNRVRPYQYIHYLTKYAWENIQIKPLETLKYAELERILLCLDPDFQRAENRMEWLSVVICATKS
jgi:SAM-dependent methyltransferase